MSNAKPLDLSLPYQVADISLADFGKKEMQLSEREMPGLMELIRRYGDVSFLDVELLTGRTHQIRVHAAESGHPLVGDDKYGDFDFNREVSKGLLGIPFRRMFLHSYSLAFEHPVTHEKMKIESSLPEAGEELIRVLNERKTV